MKPKLLILTNPYQAPSYTPRLRFLCDYLHQQGWQLDVYTEDTGDIPFEHDYPIHSIKITNGTFDWIIKTFWTLLTDWKSRYFTRQILRHIKGKHYDAVFCTTFSAFPLQSALAIANYLHIPLHADIRDLDEQIKGAQYQAHRGWWTWMFRSWYKNINIRRRNRVLLQANQITTVSPWHVDFIRQFNPHVSLIYNGFDADLLSWKEERTTAFRITYMGKLYDSSFQDPTPLFEALSQLNLPDIEVHFFGQPSIKKRLGAKAIIHEYVPISEVPDFLHQSSILLVLTHSQAKGMMTTKFFEALGVEKPVLCIPSDKGCLAEVIHDTNAGIATDNIQTIRQFILNKYTEWKENGYTRQHVLNTKPFSRQYQAKQFEALLQALCQS